VIFEAFILVFTLLIVLILILGLMHYWKLIFIFALGILILSLFNPLLDRFSEYLFKFLEYLFVIYRNLKLLLYRTRPVKIERFRYPLLCSVYHECKRKKGSCKGIVFVKDLSKNYPVTDCEVDEIEGVKLIVNSKNKLLLFPLNRIDFAVKFSKGFNWRDFLYISQHSNSLNKLQFVYKLGEKKRNCWLRLVKGLQVKNLELVDIGEDGLLFFSFGEERLIYLPWNVVELVGFSYSNYDIALCEEEEEVLDNFLLFYKDRMPAFLIKKDVIIKHKNFKSADNSADRKKEIDDLEKVW